MKKPLTSFITDKYTRYILYVVRSWYDGYVFGDSYVYCPWDVINHISSLRYKRTTKPKNYWKNTSHNGILLKDDDNRRAIIIEAKKSKKEADMDKDCDDVIDQIITEKYAEGLYGYEEILCYGVAFFQKQARVRLLNRE